MIEHSRVFREVFYIDGSLRDIYVMGTSEHDWQTLLTFLHTSPYPVQYLVDEEPHPPPERVADIFLHRQDHGFTLCIDPQQLAINCHFFTLQEIEFDIDPKDFQNDQQVSRLLDFMRTIGQLLNKAIVLTGENDAQGPLFCYDPVTNEETWFLEETSR